MLLEPGDEGGVAERREEAPARAAAAAAEEPIAHRAPRLFLHHERKPLRARIKVHHRVGPGPRDTRHAEEGELTGLEVERPIEMDVERGHVVSQAPPPPQHTGDRARQGERLARLQDRDLECAVVAGHALAHEQLGLALEIPFTRRAGPLALHPAAHEAGLAGAARAGRALVGQLDARAQAGMEDLLSGLALELALPVPGLDGDLHGRPITSAARHLDPAHGLLVGKVARLERAPQMCAWASTIRTPGMVSRSSEQVKADAA